MESPVILDKIDQFKKQTEALLVTPEYEKAFWDKFRLEFNYNSNHLEGNTLTYGHTQLLLVFDKVGGDYSLRELEEMKAHDTAMKIIKSSALDPQFQLSEKFIKEINELILVRPFYKEAITPDGQSTKRLIEPGKYKKMPNSVRLENGEVFNYASPEETPALMGDLMEFYRTESLLNEIHPVHLAALFHYRFVRVHPFDDSNGRTARLIMNFILLNNGYAPLVINSSDKKQYLTALNKADTGDIQSFTDYISALSCNWQEKYLDALSGKQIEEPEDFDKEIEILKRNLSQNKGPKLEVSEKTVRDTLFNSLFPLFKSIESELNKLRDLFSKYHIYIHCNTYAQHFESIDSIESSFDTLITNLKNGGRFTLDFTHTGFKKAGTNTFNVYSKLIVQFQNYFYRLELDNSGEKSIEKLYDEDFSENETSEISIKIARAEFNEIQRMTRNKNKT